MKITRAIALRGIGWTLCAGLIGGLVGSCGQEGEGDFGGDYNLETFTYPLSSYRVITQGPADHYYTPHQNWDIDCTIGDPILAPVAGQVVETTYSDSGYGNSVGIAVAGWGTMHLNHLDTIAVEEGCAVQAGDIVATCGNTGKVWALNGGDGSHLDVYAVDTQGVNIDLPSPKYWLLDPNFGPATCDGGPPVDCGCEGTLDAATVDGDALYVKGSLQCDAGIDKWSVVVHETTVHSEFPDSDAPVEFAATIDLSGHDLAPGEAAVGLWARPNDGDACLLDKADVLLEPGGGDDCVDVGATLCWQGDVYAQDSCGQLGALAEACAGDSVCVELSPQSAACQQPAEGCDGGGIDPGEECDGVDLGGATCQSEGYDHGQLTCTKVCTLDTSGCCQDQSYYQCSGGDVHWFDSCDGVGALKEGCGGDEVCVDTSPTTAACSANCGNGVVDPGEDCDGGVGGMSCEGLGYDGGALSCSASCSYDESGCQSCGASSYWSPSSVEQTDPLGTQNDDMISEPIRMEIKEDGPGLQFRVCKQNGLFMNDVKVSIKDGATNPDAGKLVTKLSTAGSMCSPWTPMSGDNGYAEGEKFSGVWNLVSPYDVASHWPEYGPCTVNNNPWGTCWDGSGISLTRTCK